MRWLRALRVLIETLCRRMLIIDHRRKLYDGTVDDIRTRFGGERMRIAEFSPGALDTLPYDDTGQPLLKELPAGVRQV
jgi:ABC-2 type transport system ATP-binding protein